ncbi:MAG: hypothetical protein JWL90_4118 [Chthoniobacteraceae bacterium]|nr:hypothetical protein [Chthoniobacteraceae bacterium]
MIRGLLEKELRQHSLTFFCLILTLAGGLTLIMGNRVVHLSGGTTLFALQVLHYTFVPMACFVLGQVLIAIEFRQKTQLFLEGLPLPRWRMIAVKYALGLTLILTAVGLVLALAVWKGRGSDAMTGRFLLALVLRSGFWSWFIYNLFFAFAFLGRYRLLFFVIGLIGWAALSEANVPLANFAPFQLIGGRFSYERHVIPVRDILLTGGFAVLLLGFGFFLGLVRDASLATMLSEKMSYREKMTISFLAFGAVMIFGMNLERLKRLAPVQIPGAIEVLRGGIRVGVSAAVDTPTPEEEAAIASTAARLGRELSELAAYLHCETMPPLFVVHRRDLAEGLFENGALEFKQGLMVRVNLTAKEFKPDLLLRWIVREELLVKSQKRLELERNAWVLDGFTEWWPKRGISALQIAEEMKTVPSDFSAPDLTHWLSFRKRAGEEKARSLACTAVRLLGTLHGEETRRTFLASVLGHAVQKDARAWLREAWSPVSSRFRAAVGVSLDAFVAELHTALNTAVEKT